jgi:hypothetical protein
LRVARVDLRVARVDLRVASGKGLRDARIDLRAARIDLRAARVWYQFWCKAETEIPNRKPIKIREFRVANRFGGGRDAACC